MAVTVKKATKKQCKNNAAKMKEAAKRLKERTKMPEKNAK